MSVKRHNASHSHFVLINGDTGMETRLQWTQQCPPPSEAIELPRESYLEKKTLLNRLSTGTQSSSKSSTQFVIRDGFSLGAKNKANDIVKESLPTKNYLYAHLSRDIPDTLRIDTSVLLSLRQPSQSNNRVIGIVYARAFGLRFKMQHCFVTACQKGKKNHDHPSLQKQIRSQIKDLQLISKRKLYFFHLSGEPVNSVCAEIKKIEKVVVVDLAPKLNLPYEMRIQLADLTSKVESAMLECGSSTQESQLASENQSDTEYDWKKIGNVEEYVNRLFQNPEAKQKQVIHHDKQLTKWYQEQFKEVEVNRPNDRNPLFESSSHYEQEVLNQKMLHEASQKVEMLPNTNNRHRLRQTLMTTMMDKVRRQSKLELPKMHFLEPPLTKKEMQRRLDNKHSLLNTQNIPYLIEKYGINRYEVYKLFNLYKSFEKVSAMRANRKDFPTVLEKGVDRATFDEGLKNLDMNPGEELIKGISPFGDFINWEEFLKIISISLRKTPEQKLEAILQGISSGKDKLSRLQIDVMIGSSLVKIFDSEQHQLRIYFTKMAMAELDPENTGQVPISLLKEKVLLKGNANLNMVSFLILNS